MAPSSTFIFRGLVPYFCMHVFSIAATESVGWSRIVSTMRIFVCSCFV